MVFEESQINYCLDPAIDHNHILDLWKTPSTDIPEELTKDRDLQLKREACMTLKKRAPHYSDVELSGNLVNPTCKPHCVLIDIIMQFSSCGDNVLDFFSGGSMLKSAFSSRPECFVYSDTRKEFDFMKLYPSSIQVIPSIIRLWEKVASINRDEKIDDHDDDDDITIVPDEVGDAHKEDFSRFEVGLPILAFPETNDQEKSNWVERLLTSSRLQLSLKGIETATPVSTKEDNPMERSHIMEDSPKEGNSKEQYFPKETSPKGEAQRRIALRRVCQQGCLTIWQMKEIIALLHCLKTLGADKASTYEPMEIYPLDKRQVPFL